MQEQIEIPREIMLKLQEAALRNIERHHAWYRSLSLWGRMKFNLRSYGGRLFIVYVLLASVAINKVADIFCLPAGWHLVFSFCGSFVLTMFWLQSWRGHRQ